MNPTGKGKKTIKDTPVLYEDKKKQRGILLTDTAWKIVAIKAKKQGISLSEYVERLIREHGKFIYRVKFHPSSKERGLSLSRVS